MGKFLNSRGELQELRSVEANLIATSQHLYDIPEWDESIAQIITDVNKGRMALKKMYEPEDGFDLDFHCADKHMQIARMAMLEYIESQVRKGGEPDMECLDFIEEAGGRVFQRLMKVPDSAMTEKGCYRCVEDYYFGDDEPMTEDDYKAKHQVESEKIESGNDYDNDELILIDEAEQEFHTINPVRVVEDFQKKIENLETYTLNELKRYISCVEVLENNASHD